MKKKISIMIFVLLLLPAIYACGKDSRQNAEVDVVEDEKWVALEKGKTAKDFSLHDMKGNMVSLSDFRGKVVFLNFWATWCAPCRHEMPDLEKLHNKYKEGDLVVLAVSTDKQGLKVVQPYIDEEGFTLTVLIDSNSDVSDSYGVFALPTTFIIDRDGKIVEMIQGIRDWFDKEVLDYLDELIAKGEIA